MPRTYIIAKSLAPYPALKTFLGSSNVKEIKKSLKQFDLFRKIYDIEVGKTGDPEVNRVKLSLLEIISLLSRRDLLRELIFEGRTRKGWYLLEKAFNNALHDALLRAIRNSDGLVGQELLELAPHGFIVSLSPHRNLDPEGIKYLRDILQSGNCPEGLTLNLTFNDIRDEGAIALAEALQSGNCPTGLTLSLSDNGIRDEGAIALAEALQSGKCPAGLTLNLSGNGIRDEGAIALAEALQSGKCPAGLTLNLSDNGIRDEGAKAIARALVSQTSVIVLGLAGGIALLSNRNRLLAKYPQCHESINFAFAPICQKILSEGPGMMEKKSSVSGVPKLRFFAARTLLEEAKQPQSEVGKNLKEQLKNLREIQRLERKGKPIKEEMQKSLDKSLPRDLLEELMFLQDEIPQEFQQAMPKKEGPL